MTKNDYFFVYETTNLVNGMKYRGIHKTKKINDNYLGSGKVFVNAIQKYGKENFKREMIFFNDIIYPPLNCWRMRMVFPSLYNVHHITNP